MLQQHFPKHVARHAIAASHDQLIRQRLRNTGNDGYLEQKLHGVTKKFYGDTEL
jgi:hypothetical protein